jgi:uncharacterized protein (TIGR00730 family)
VVRTDAPLITVFGSSRAVRGDKLYEEGVLLGAELARGGFRVCTGGYGGLMEAVSHGAVDAGAKPIGVTFEAFGGECNPFVREHRPAPDIFARLQQLVMNSDGFVVMRGGMGTIAELMLTWINVESGLRPAAPIVLLGESWRVFTATLHQHFTFTNQDFSLVRYSDTPEGAVQHLREALGDQLPHD